MVTLYTLESYVYIYFMGTLYSCIYLTLRDNGTISDNISAI